MKRARHKLRALFALTPLIFNTNRRRKLHLEQLECRRVFTLPASQTFAEGDMVVYNGPTVDTVNDALSFDAFIDFAGDVDSFFFAPQFTGTYTIDVGDFGNTVDPEVAIYIASSGTQIGYNDDLSSFNDDARLVVNLTADVLYIIAVADEPGTVAGNVSIVVSAPFRTGSFLLAPDTFGDATTLVLIDVATDIDYYSFTAPADATGGLSITAAATFNHRLALFNSSGTLLAGPLLSINYASVIPNQEYRLAIFSNNYATSGSAELTINFAQPGALVTNTLDTGPGSLRQAILDANAHPNVSSVPDKIVFSIPGVGPHNIVLTSPLPFISDAVEIDGNTQPGTGATPTVAIDGTALVGINDGLRIDANQTIVRKLNIRKFSGDGIEVQASAVLLEGNTIGTDWAGLNGFGNGGYGIRIQNGASNRVESNVVAANGLSGIAVLGDTADNNVLMNNTVGARLAGNFALPNAANGIVITDGDSNEISGNLISGNALAGVVISGTAVTNTLINNKIGTTIFGGAALPNGGDGVFIQSPRNKIGGNLPTLRNLISGNGKSGITLSGVGASNNVIEGNYIGTSLNGTAAVPNATDGIRVINAARNRIGSATDAAAGNVISGNVGSGIALSAAGSTGGLVLGNLIGTTANGVSALGNTGSGVLIFSAATNVQIGGTSAISRNVIAGNGASGITISSTATNNRVSRNRIGVNISGAARGNANAGIALQGPNNTIGGANATFGNIIAGNPQGITVSGASATGNTIAFNNIGTDTVPNTGRGIHITGGASNNTIGPKNTIRRNETGIRIEDGSIGNRITQNSIAENINLGIDLLPGPGFTANDGGDADTGGNRLQNYPQLSGNPQLIGTSLEIAFSVNSSPVHAAYPLTIDFYVSDGGGEGATFLASTIYTAANFAAGVKTVSFAGVGAGLSVGVTKIVGTATDLNGNTSEFSLQRTLAAGLAVSGSAVQQSRNALDVNGDGRLSSNDALQLVSYLNANSVSSQDKVFAPTSSTPYADVDVDGSISRQDLLLVIRGIQLNASNSRAVVAINRLIDTNVWDASLVEVIADGLRDVSRALAISRIHVSSQTSASM